MTTVRELFAFDSLREQSYARWLSYYTGFAGFGFWAAIGKSTGEFLGWFHFRPSSNTHPDEVELGYRLGRDGWGQGYATEVSRALVRKGFTELGVQRVVASTDAAHTASRRVMEKAGLTLARTFRSPWPELPNGPDQEAVEYALLKADWEQRDARARGVNWRQASAPVTPQSPHAGGERRCSADDVPLFVPCKHAERGTLWAISRQQAWEVPREGRHVRKHMASGNRVGSGVSRAVERG